MTRLDPATAEECAKVAERQAKEWLNGEAGTVYGSGYQAGCRNSASAIRLASGETQSSDGGVEARHAATGNMLGSVPREEMSAPATGFERATVREAAIQPCAGVAPGPSETIDACKAHALAWHRQIVEAGGSESVAHQAVTLAALNGLFDHVNADPVVRQDCAPAETADKNCVTLPNGDCIGKGCMHDDSSHPVAGLTEETPLDVLNGIRDALESRGYVHMANGRDIGNLIDELRRLTSSPVSEEELGNAIRQNCIIALWQDDADALARALLSQFSIGRK
jgi:hypothetical protein